MDSKLSPASNVVVIGAGVIGLQAAIELLEAGRRVIIIAKHVPGDESIEYTSPWAGAQWRPHASPQDTEQQAWDLATYRHWTELIQRGLGEDAGLAVLPELLLYDDRTHPDLAPSTNGVGAGFWFAPEVKSFSSAISPPKHIADQVAVARRYDTVFVDVPLYLAFLVRRIDALGGKLLRAELPVNRGMTGLLDAAAALADGQVWSFVNATGMAAGVICGDKGVYPARGQVLIVKGTAKQGTSRLGIDEGGRDYIAYVIPRPHSNTTVIGGVKEKGRWHAEEDGHTSRLIRSRCKVLCPELLTGRDGDFEVLGVQVGLRPGREGGARVQKELVGKRTVVHAYGVAGAGYQNSVGIARKVNTLMSEAPAGML